MGSLTHIPAASCPRQQQRAAASFPAFLFLSSLFPLSLSFSLFLHLCAATSPLASALTYTRYFAWLRRVTYAHHTDRFHRRRCLYSSENWSQVDQLIAPPLGFPP